MHSDDPAAQSHFHETPSDIFSTAGPLFSSWAFASIRHQHGTDKGVRQRSAYPFPTFTTMPPRAGFSCGSSRCPDARTCSVNEPQLRGTGAGVCTVEEMDVQKRHTSNSFPGREWFVIHLYECSFPHDACGMWSNETNDAFPQC